MGLVRSVDGLDPELRKKLGDMLEEGRQNRVLGALGYRIAVNETVRTLPVQMAYYSRGRMASASDVKAMFKAAGLWELGDAEAMRKVTWTLESKHLRGLAFDAGPSKDGSEVDWGAPKEAWDAVARIGKALGLVCGAYWTTPDPPHFELP